MTSDSFDRPGYRTQLTVVVAIAGLSGLGSLSAAAQDARSVKANYEVSYAGVSIGDFTFDSKIDGGSYTINSATSIKLLFGAFKWTSRSVSRGNIRKITVAGGVRVQLSLQPEGVSQRNPFCARRCG